MTGGGDFSFPSGIEHWLTLDQNAGTDNYTIIFSPEQLTEPGFLKSEAGKKLSESDQADLKDFVARYQTSEVATEINDIDADAPFIAIKVPQGAASGAPVVFEIRVEHK